jgi:hypothetical protein
MLENSFYCAEWFDQSSKIFPIDFKWIWKFLERKEFKEKKKEIEISPSLYFGPKAPKPSFSPFGPEPAGSPRHLSLPGTQVPPLPGFGPAEPAAPGLPPALALVAQQQQLGPPARAALPSPSLLSMASQPHMAATPAFFFPAPSLTETLLGGNWSRELRDCPRPCPTEHFYKPSGTAAPCLVFVFGSRRKAYEAAAVERSIRYRVSELK